MPDPVCPTDPASHQDQSGSGCKARAGHVRPRSGLVACTALVLALLAPGMVVPGAALAAPMDPVAPQQTPGPQDRSLRYFDMTLQDAMYTALVEGDFEFAVATLGGLAGMSNSRELLDYVTGVQALKRGDYTGAEAAFARSGTDDLPTAALLMVTRAQLGNAGGARDAWVKAGEEIGGAPFHKAWLGWLAERTGDDAEALRLWREADAGDELLFNPAIAKRYFILLARADGNRAALARMDDLFGPAETMSAEMRQLRGQIQRGRAQLPQLTPSQAGAQFLGDFITLMQLARMSPGRPARGRQAPDPDGEFINDALYLRTALALEPGNGRLREQLAGLLSDFGEPGAARAVLEAPGGPPPTSDTWMELGDYAADQSRTRDAIGYLERVPAADRTSSWYIARSSAALSLGQNSEAVRLAGEAVRLAQRTGDERVLAIGRWRQSFVLFRTGDKAGGERALQQALDGLEADDVVRAYAGMMLAAFVPERRDEGIQIARTLQGRFGDTHHFRSVFGGLLSDREETLEEGVELLRAALEARPRSATMLNALGYTLVDKDVDLREGFLLLQRAHERLPDDPSIVDSLGWAYYRLGHLDEARELVEQSARMFAEDPNAEVFDHLGDIYWHLGRQEEAREQWRKALPISAGYSGAADLPGKIANGLTTPPPPRQPIPVDAEPDSI